ncbi:hypothetical protein C1H46_022944 [Malus baccata]|uniref:Cystatin domain-containing protein n=1 Tax=Malus baccata TaxID=106549 RepID=A0A540LYQ0_MALBA|nr:hypothetical protein C1H46_022944 [Malus baccata]
MNGIRQHSIYSFAISNHQQFSNSKTVLHLYIWICFTENRKPTTMRPHCFLALLTLLTLAAAAATREASPPWKEIKDLKDPYPYVISIAEWGVSEYNKNVTGTGTNKLVFQNVTWGESAFISDTFYGLIIAAKN